MKPSKHTRGKVLFQSPSPCFRRRAFASPTSVSGVEGCEGDDKEGGGVFPSVHQVGEGSLGVAVTPQALDETEPGGQTLDDGAQAVRVAVANVAAGICNGTQQNIRNRFCVFSLLFG